MQDALLFSPFLQQIELQLSKLNSERKRDAETEAGIQG